MIGTDSVLDLQAGDGDVAIRYATSRTAPTDGIAEELLSDTFWPVCNPHLLSHGRSLKRPADLAKHVLDPLLLVASRPRAAHLAEMARRCPAQVARCARIQGHAAPELPGGAACHRGGDRRTGHRHLQRRARGTRARRRHAREGIRSELAGLSLLCRPGARPSARESHPGLLEVVAGRRMSLTNRAGRLLRPTVRRRPAREKMIDRKAQKP